MIYIKFSINYRAFWALNKNFKNISWFMHISDIQFFVNSSPVLKLMHHLSGLEIKRSPRMRRRGDRTSVRIIFKTLVTAPLLKKLDNRYVCHRSSEMSISARCYEISIQNIFKSVFKIFVIYNILLIKEA